MNADPAPDAAVIEQLREVGSDLSKPHLMEFYLYLPTQAAAERIAARVREIGCVVSKIEQAALGPGWLVLATRSIVPTESSLRELREQFESMVAVENGEYDGWEAEVVK